jgi:putative flippase GtrA
MMISQSAQRWLRFVIGGGINTGFTYIIYLYLNTLLPYQFAYLLSYTVGVIFAYWYNASIVFCVPLSWKGLFSYPVVYVVHYLASAFFLVGLVELLQISEVIAPLLVAGAMIPVSYVLSKFVLGVQAPKQSLSRRNVSS